MLLTRLFHLGGIVPACLAIATPSLLRQDRVVTVLQNATCQLNSKPDTSDLGNANYTSNVNSVRLQNDRTYRFVWYKPAPSKTYLLFLHGFPSTSYDWRRQIDYFAGKGYGIIAPDLLGYGGTDKPSDLQTYRLKTMVSELVELLDCVGAEKVVSVSHDWGSLLQSRFWTYHPERISSLVFLDIGYFAAPLALGPGSAKAINSATRLLLGYPIFGYWFFFTQPDAAGIMDTHPRSASSLMYANEPKMQSSNFCDPDALRAWLTTNKTAPPSPWLPESELETFERITAKNGGYAGGLRWYASILSDVNTADEQAAASLPTAISVPTMLITAANDPIGLPVFARGMVKPYATKYTERSVEAGHFLQVEKSAETNQHLEAFLVSL